MRHHITFYLAAFILGSCIEEQIKPGHISDLLWLEHKGAQMPILIEGKRESKVLILILHGGPGGNSRAYNEQNVEMSIPLEEEFKVAYWDQRLAGNTRGKYNGETLTVAQMKEDLDLVIKLLYNQYGNDQRVFLLGHSWGGFLGNAYLADPIYNQQIAGWINVDGPHDLSLLIREATTFMKDHATLRIQDGSPFSENWNNILAFIQSIDTSSYDTDLFLKINSEGVKAMGLAKKEGVINSITITKSEFINSLFEDHNPITASANASANGNRFLLGNALLSPTFQLNNINLPTLFLWGQYDFLVPPMVGQIGINSIGSVDKKMVVFDRAEHSPMDSSPDSFVSEVKNFINSH
jgi:pimeloyl-ACP methyl ester carboxylesterase